MPYVNGNANMATMNPFDEYNTEDAAGKGRKKNKKIARNISGMPDHVYDSIKRQYKGGPDYTIEDKKNVINYYKKQKKGKV